MTLIDSRPIEINNCSVYGNWEGNLIIGKGHKSARCVLVERKSRYIQLDLLETYDATKTIEKRFKKLEPELMKSLTLDRRYENSEHRELTKNTRIMVYFCHPHSLWEKWTCENTNYLVRDMLYPKDDFWKLAQRDTRVARLLNK